jgi:hypothetical protein
MAMLNDRLETSALKEFGASGTSIELLEWLPDRVIQALSERIKQGLRTPY